jgi:hypothetical protein
MLNRVGILTSQKPLSVSVLAKKMVDEALQNTQGKTVYQPKDIEL